MGQYGDVPEAILARALLEARNEALEEAADWVEQHVVGYRHYPASSYHVGEMAAEKIRALKCPSSKTKPGEMKMSDSHGKSGDHKPADGSHGKSGDEHGKGNDNLAVVAAILFAAGKSADAATALTDAAAFFPAEKE